MRQCARLDTCQKLHKCSYNMGGGRICWDESHTKRESEQKLNLITLNFPFARYAPGQRGKGEATVEGLRSIRTRNQNEGFYGEPSLWIKVYMDIILL